MKPKLKLIFTVCLLSWSQISTLLNAQSTPPLSNQQPSLLLTKGWKSLANSTQNLVARDMSIILKNSGAQAEVDLASKDITIWQGVKYLMPLSKALEAIGLNDKTSKLRSKSLSANPAFPSHSFYVINFDVTPFEIEWENNERFGSGYQDISKNFDLANRANSSKMGKVQDELKKLNLNPYSLTEPKRQKVSQVHFLADASSQVIGLGFSGLANKKSLFKASSFWHTYDFINLKEKASPTSGIRHHYANKDQVIRIYSEFGKAIYDWYAPLRSLTLDQGDAFVCFSEYYCVFFAPAPVANLILANVK